MVFVPVASPMDWCPLLPHAVPYTHCGSLPSDFLSYSVAFHDPAVAVGHTHLCACVSASCV